MPCANLQNFRPRPMWGNATRVLLVGNATRVLLVGNATRRLDHIWLKRVASCPEQSLLKHDPYQKLPKSIPNLSVMHQARSPQLQHRTSRKERWKRKRAGHPSRNWPQLCQLTSRSQINRFGPGPLLVAGRGPDCIDHFGRKCKASSSPAAGHPAGSRET